MGWIRTGSIKKILKKFLNKITHTLGLEIRNHKLSSKKEFISLDAKSLSKGNVLIAYILDPFLLNHDEPISSAHTHYTESLLMAKTYLDLGYSVDVIDYRNAKFIPHKDYVFFVSARTNLEKIKQRLNKDCVVIAHMDTAHFLFNNYAAYKRSLALQKRKNVTLISKKIVENNFAIENADYVTILGNDFTVSTYSYAGKPMFTLHVPSHNVYNLNRNKNYHKCKNRFLWFGSSGLVHKGLDLVLEAFLEMPNCHLTICGPIHEENDFINAFFKEFYQTPNINTVGWVDISSNQFMEIANNSIALIYPSCSEGQSGAVITCLQAGLIPIISYESGVDVEDFGLILKDCSVIEIKKAIQYITTQSTQDLAQMSLKAWDYANKNHTGENYVEEYKRIINKIAAEKISL